MKWEYRVEKVVSGGQAIGIAKPTDVAVVVAEALNRFGDEGWELVTVGGPLPDPTQQKTVALLYLKRPQP